MGRYRRPPDSVEVEELVLPAWPGTDPGGGRAGEMGGTPDASTSAAATGPAGASGGRTWWRSLGRHRGALAVGAAIGLVGAATAAFVTGPRSPGESTPATTTPPTATAPAAAATTAPRPIAPTPTTSPRSPAGATGGTAGNEATGTGTAAASADAGAAAGVDYRAALLEVPDGMQVVTAYGERAGGTSVTIGLRDVGYQMFAPTGASASSGPWVLVATGGHDAAVEQRFPFSRPPATSLVEGRELVTGTGAALTGRTDAASDEQALIRSDDLTLAVVTHGTPVGTAAALARSATFAGGSVALGPGAMPDGFARVDADAGLWVDGSSRARRGATTYASGTSANVTQFAQISTQPYDPRDPLAGGAAFLLDEVRYGAVGPYPAVAGTVGGRDGAERWVVWNDGAVEYLLDTWGMEVEDALALAGEVVSPRDPRWTESIWTDVSRAAAGCCASANDEPAIRTVAWLGTPSDLATETWRLQYQGSVTGRAWFTLTGNNIPGAALPAPTPEAPLGVAATPIYAWQDGAPDAYVMAVAVLDRAQEGAVLRLSVAGSSTYAAEVTLQPVDGIDELAPYIVAGATLPWTAGGLTAVLATADGTVLATATDADLP